MPVRKNIKSNAEGLTARVMDAISYDAGNVPALPPIEEAMDRMMDEGLQTIGEKNAQYFKRSDDDGR